jgi:hypothetical protein
MVESGLNLSEALKFVTWLDDVQSLTLGERAAITLAEEFTRLQIGIVDALSSKTVDRDKLIELLAVNR